MEPAGESSQSRILLGENLELLGSLEDESFQLIYIDPPFNTGSERRHTALRVIRDDDGGRRGFQGRRYRSEALSSLGYRDSYEDYLASQGLA